MTARQMTRAQQAQHKRDMDRVSYALRVLNRCSPSLQENEDWRVARARLENLLSENLGRWVV